MRWFLLAGLISTAIAGSPHGANADSDPDPIAIREAIESQVAGIIGADGLTRVRPMVDDATSRAIDAVRAVDRTERTPRQILDRSQRFHLIVTRGGGMTDLNLRPDQKEALARYAADVIRSVRPIVEDDGRRIDGMLSPDEAAKLGVLETGTLARLTSVSTKSAPLGLDPNASLANGAVPTPGEFVLLAELDYRSIAMKSR